VGGNLTLSGTVSATTVAGLNVGGNLSIGDGTTFNAAGFALTVTGTTTVGNGTSGILNITSATGTKTFAGLVTINPGGAWKNITANSPVTFEGGITLNGTGAFNAGTGVHTFSNNSQTLTGTFSIPSVTVTGVTLNNSGTLTVGTALSGSGGLTQGTGATLNIGGTLGITTLTATATGNTVNYTGASQTVHNNNYYNLTLSGSGTDALGTSTTTVSGNLTLSGTVSVATVVGLTISGNLGIGDGTTFNAAGFALTVTGTTTVGNGTSGILNITSATGTKIFAGLVTINTGGAWNNTTANSPVTFEGGITLNGTGTLNAGTGVHTFSNNSQTLTGTFSIPSVTVTGVTLNNSGTLTVGTALSGSGGLTQGAGATLNIGGTSGITTLTATATGNTVSYTGAAQTVVATTYNNLVFSGSGAKSMATGISATGNLSIAPTGTATASVGTGLDLTVNSLTLGGVPVVSGTWGSTTATGAVNHNNTYFAATTGYLTVSTGAAGTRLIVTLPGQTFTSGTGNSGTVSGQTAGTPFSIALRVVDGLNGVDTSYAVSQTVSYSGPANAPGGASPTYTTTVTFTAGQASGLTTTLVDAQTTTITPSISGLTGVASSNLTVSAAAASATTVETAANGSGTVVGAQNITAGNSITVYAITRDSSGNFVANPSATWSLQNITGGVVSGDLVAGGASAVFTGHKLGSATIQAVASGFTGDSGTQTVLLGPIASYSVTAATPQTRGTAFNVTVTAVDAGGNTVTTDNSTQVTMTSSTGNVQFSGNPATPSGGTFTLSALDNYFETATITATDGNGKTGNTSATVNPLIGDYRSQATGNWTAAATWQTNNGTGSSGWFTAVSPPTNGTFTGEINVQGGYTVTVNASVSVPASLFVLNSGSTVSISSGFTLTVGNGEANGVISGSGVLAESGTGTVLTLSGNNTYSGGTTITGGTVSVTNVTTSGTTQLGTGAITFASGGTLLNTGPGAQTTSRSITNNAGGGVITMSGNTITLTGNIYGNGGLTNGGSDLILDRSSGNNAIGPITVTSGRLFAFNTNSIGNSSITVQSGGTLDFSTGGNTVPSLNTMTFASGSCLANRAGTLTVSTANVTFPTSGTMIFNNDDQVSTAITVSGAYPALTGPLTVQVGGQNATVGTVTLSGAISGSGGLTKTSTGTLVLGSANTYTGGTTVSAGSVTANVNNSLNGGTLSVASGATVTLTNGTTNTVAALYLGGAPQVSGTWGSTASSASNKNSTYFGTTATGILDVQSGTANAYRITAASGTPTAGASDVLTIKLVDASGNVVTTFTGSKTLTFSGLGNSPGNNVPTVAGVSLGTGTTISFVNGVSSGTVNLIAYDAQTATLAATDGTLSTSSTGGAGVSLTVGPASPSELAMKTEPSSSVTAGVAFSSQPAVYVEDTYGNVVTTDNSSMVTASVQAGTGPLTGTTTATASGGVATFTALAAPTLAQTGLQLKFTDSSTGSPTVNDTTSIMVNAGPASKLTYTILPSTGTAGTAFSVTVQSQDANGNPSSPTSNTTITLSKATGGGSLSGTLTGTIATSGNSVTIATGVYSKADTMTLTATATAGETTLTPVTSGSIVFSAGAATQLAYTSVPSTGTAGTAFSVTVQSQDANGNPSSPTSNTTITLSQATGGGSLSGTLTGTIATSGNSVTIATGVYSKADTMTLTATATAGETTLTPVTSGSIVFSAGAATQLVYTSVPSTGTAGTAFSVTVQSQDANGNPSSPTSNTTITLSKATGGGSLSGTLTGTIATSGNSVTIATGVYSKADTMTLTATATAGETTLTPVTSGSVVFSAGTASAIIVETKSDGTGTVVPAQDVAINNSITVYAIARDPNGNFVANVAADAWSLPTKTGGVVDGDLVAAGDKKSAVFTGHEPGTATIRATSGTLSGTDSGILTVIHLVQFVVGSTNGVPSQQVVVPVRVNGFTNLSSLQFSMHWDPTAADFVDVEQFGLPGLTSEEFGTNETSSGTLMMLWYDLSGYGTNSVPDGTTMFAVRFLLHGSPGTTNSVTIDGSPIPIEVLDANLDPATVESTAGQLVISSVESLAIYTSSLPNGCTNVPYTAALTAVGGTAPYNTWTVVGGALPTGLTLDGTSGAIAGTPTATGVFNFVAGVSDSSDPVHTATQPLSIAITTNIYGNGPGGPILVLANAANPFSSYYAEILLAEGMNEFALEDISSVDSGTLANYDVILLGETALTSDQVTLLTDWVTAGGRLIAMRPDKQLAGLLGLTDALGTITNAYLLVDTSSGPGVGIVGQTIQFHGVADQYILNGATSLATLYSDAQTSAGNPAVTLRGVGLGQAAAFTFDLARSIVYTRQGNPAWSGEERDGQLDQTVEGEPGVIRAVDLFYGAASFDPEPDWVDLNNVAVPQADEEQRLLANMILTMHSAKSPLPRFWYFPHGYKAVVVMTGDDHAGTYGGSYATTRFDAYLAASPQGGSVADWTVPRCTANIFVSPNPCLANDAQAAAYNAAGFEIVMHLNTGCSNYTGSSLDAFFTDQMDQFIAKYPSLPAQTTHRIHCVAWSDYSTAASVSRAHGIRLETSYYYWPPTWVANQPGFFTGSGMPMRFADTNGNIMDIYQAPTEMTDESGQSYPYTVDSLLDGALGAEGYYGAFVANMHTDSEPELGAEAIFTSATNRGVPIISARQLLTWVDARNSSSFTNIVWDSSNTRETFSVRAGPNARGLQVMLPLPPAGYNVSGVLSNGNAITYYYASVKGLEYVMFEAGTGDYGVTFSTDSTPPSISQVTPAIGATDVNRGANVTVKFSEAMNASTINASTITLWDARGIAVPATVSYNPTNFTAILQPNSILLGDLETYTAKVEGGATGVTDVAGNPLGSGFQWTFTTGHAGELSIWSDAAVPTHPTFDPNDMSSYEFGVAFESDVNGYVTGVRFYKGPSNSGTHIGNLWTADGLNLASATFTGESASGWQEVSFATPVAITAGTAYIASYFDPQGGYSADVATDPGNLLAGVDNPPLHALANSVTPNGVLIQSSTSAFPSRSEDGVNYWVDVAFLAPTPPTVVSVNPAAGATGVSVGTAVTVTFSEPLNAATVNGTTITLQDASHDPVAATVTYNAATFAAVLTPVSRLATLTSYTVGVSTGVTDEAGNALAGAFSSTFTTQAPVTTPPTVSSESPVNGATGVGLRAVVTVTFSTGMDPTTISGSTITLQDGGGKAVAAAVSYNAATYTATLTPNALLHPDTNYIATVQGGVGGVADLFGNVLASDFVWSFTTVLTIWSDSSLPSTPLANDSDPYELGVKFTSDVSGYVTGVRFYKGGVANGGTHIGHLWAATGGSALASATFTGETASGWQEVDFATPVLITANTMYIASYYAPEGNYAIDTGLQPGGLLAGVNNPPLHAVANSISPNGVFLQQLGGGFPSQSGDNGANYWVDVVFMDTTPPTVVSVNPAAGASGVSVGTTVTVTFSEPLNAATVNGSTITLQDAKNNAVAATVTYNAGTFAAVLTPVSRLATLTSYTVGVSTGVTDEAGNALAGAFSSTFTTQAPVTTPPTVSSESPVNGATGVGLRAVVTVTFSTGMDPTTISGSTITLQDGGGKAVAAAVSYNAATYTATLTPNALLHPDTNYIATVQGGVGGVADLFGNVLASDFVWSFTTVLTIWSDSSLPSTPLANDSDPYELGVKFTSDVSGYVTGVRFYKGGVANGGTHIGHLWAATGGSALASATFTGETASGWQEVDFATPVLITANTMYIASYYAPEGNYAIDTGLQPGGLLAGVNNPPLHAVANSISPNGVFLQQLGGGFPSQSGDNGANYWVDVVFMDTTPPTVVSVNPAAGASGVSVGTTVTVTFSEPLNAATVNGSTITLQDAKNNAVAATVTYNAGTFAAVLTPVSRLATLTSYTVGVSTGVTDEAGNALAGAFSSTFTTQAPVTTPPTVSSESPVNGATGVGLRAVVTVTFSTGMDPTTISGSTITLQDGGGKAVAAAVSYNAATYTATLTPNALLHPDTNYIATVQGGVGGVADLFGNVLASDFVWSFTTVLTIWSDSSLPSTPLAADSDPYELGVKFTSDVSGYVTGVRFYKGGVANGGTHIGHLWAATGGSALASATFAGETASGWQEVTFATPVLITANTMHIASYYAPEGNYAIDTGLQPGGLLAGVNNPPLHAVANSISPNGVFLQQLGGGFPSQSSTNGANYWVDVAFEPEVGVSVAGTVAYYPTNYPASGLSGKVVGGVTMTVTGDTNLSGVTLGDGSYALGGIAIGGTYCVTPSKAYDSPTNLAVTTADAALIQRYVVGLATLDSPYKLLAADVNANGVVNTADATMIQRMVVGLLNTFPAGTWRFVPANYVFPDPQNPWNAPSNVWYTNLVADVSDGDFIAIRLGDLNNSWTAPAGGSSSQARRVKVPAKGAQGSEAFVTGTVPEVVFGVNQQSAQPGQTVTVGVTVSGFRQVTSAQFSLAWDPAVLRYVGTRSYGLRGMSAGSFGSTLTGSGKLAFGWYDPEAVGVTLGDGTVLFSVSFEVIGKAGSVSAVAVADAPTAQDVGVDFGLAGFGAHDGSVTVVGPGVLVSNSVYAKGVFRLSVPTEQGRSYSLEYSDTLAPTKWTALPAVVGDGTAALLVDPAATNQQRFYRVHVQ
jgi:hypothetical protein